MSTPELEQAYVHCMDAVRSHYENFPVATLLLPAALRRPIAVIYTFARTADDIADEGDPSSQKRHQALDAFSAQFRDCVTGTKADGPLFIALADVITHYQLPQTLFEDMLTAFRMDIDTRRYATFVDVLHYCRHSANPVGRLLLHLVGEATPQHLAWSDSICSALQLINFYQDLAQDFDENGRIYIAQDEMTACGVTEEHFADRRSDAAMRSLMQLQYRRARQMMLSGAPLGHAIRGRFGLQLRMMISGGLAVLHALESAPANVFSRPRLRRRDWLWMSWRAITG